MRSKSKWSIFLGGQRERAPPQRRAHVIGGIEFFHPVLDCDVGERVGCSRLPREPDDAYALRLGARITAIICEHEALLNQLLNFKR